MPKLRNITLELDVFSTHTPEKPKNKPQKRSTGEKRLVIYTVTENKVLLTFHQK